MLSNTSRSLAYLNAILYSILGAFLFLLPKQLAPVFAWKVTAFMTMTIGGWCLGNAWLAYFIAKRWDWQRVYTTLIYLWSFGITELIVLYFFRAKLALVHPIAWLYFITLLVNVISAIVGIVEWLRNHPARALDASQTTTLQRTLAIGFVVFVGFLGYYGLTAQIGDPGTNGGIFPEIMSLFTLRSFGAFYLSLSIAALPLIWEKSLKTLLQHAVASYGLIIFITIAALAYIRLFDFVARPLGAIYIGIYLLVGIVTAIVMWKNGTGN
jgi:hypothetical protein